MKTHVVFCMDRAGLVGSDGHTHNGIFDISYMMPMPDMTIFVPTDYEDMTLCMKHSINKMNSPVAIRYSKAG